MGGTLVIPPDVSLRLIEQLLIRMEFVLEQGSSEFPLNQTLAPG